MALLKKGKKGAPKKKNGKKQFMQSEMAGEQYESMMTPRNDGQNMERVDEEQAEDVGQEESQ